MHAFLAYLTRHSPGVVVRYGVAVVAIAFVTAFRFLVPLDVAPFFLYLPIVFLVSVALGRGPGHVGTLVSAVSAAGFFVRDGRPSLLQLDPKQYVALIEYIVVGTAMVEVCVALRRILLSNEAALARLQTIVDTVPVGIMLAEAPSGRIVGRNRRLDEIVGTASERAKTADEYGAWRSFHADGRRVEAADYPLARVLKGAAEATLQVQYERKDGSRDRRHHRRRPQVPLTIARRQAAVDKQGEPPRHGLRARLIRRQARLIGEPNRKRS